MGMCGSRSRTNWDEISIIYITIPLPLVRNSPDDPSGEAVSDPSASPMVIDETIEPSLDPATSGQ
jgi:hypothetical protein